MNVSESIRGIIKSGLEKGLAYSFLSTPELLINNQTAMLLKALEENNYEIVRKENDT